MSVKPSVWCLLLFLAAGPVLTSTPAAQSSTALSFEVASIKPNKSEAGFTMFGLVQPGGRITITNATLREMIGVAYQLRDFQISGGPGWIGSERYDIVAKAEGELPPPPPQWSDTSPAPVFLMLRSLFAERFKFVAHIETRDAPIYSLVMARSDRKLGPQLSPSNLDCTAIRAARARTPAGPPPPPPPPPKPGEKAPPCTNGGGFGHAAGGTMPLAALVLTLSRMVDRVVLDRTGLTGNFDYTLDFTPDQMPPVPPGGALPNAPPPPRADGPSLFAALQEQLGLKLEPERGPVEFLVIDQVERPTEN